MRAVSQGGSAIQGGSAGEAIRAVQIARAAIQSEALELLEWPRLCRQVATFAATPAGRRQVEALPLGATAAESQVLLGETTELLALDGLTEGGLSFQGVAHLRHTVALCAKGGCAAGEALLEVASTLAAARRLRRQIDDPALRPITTALVAELRTLPELEQRLRFCLEEGGRVADRASPALQGLRLQLGGVRTERRERLQDLLRRWAPMLQDTVIAERNGRPVLAVKVGAASQLAGLVHDSSASGSTVFLEPQAVIPLGNRIRDLEGQERELEQAVLKELSQLVGADSEALGVVQTVLLRLETALARARYSAWIGGLRPELSANPLAPWALEGLRHPLLLWQERQEGGQPVVPVSVRVEEPVRVVAITGPNTGGKTVTLKAVGLAALMARAGLFLPCGATPRLPWCSQVLADIGDEQSLQQNLSTFSGHIRRIARILEALPAASERSGRRGAPAAAVGPELGAFATAAAGRRETLPAAVSGGVEAFSTAAAGGQQALRAVLGHELETFAMAPAGRQETLPAAVSGGVEAFSTTDGGGQETMPAALRHGLEAFSMAPPEWQETLPAAVSDGVEAFSTAAAGGQETLRAVLGHEPDPFSTEALGRQETLPAAVSDGVEAFSTAAAGGQETLRAALGHEPEPFSTEALGRQETLPAAVSGGVEVLSTAAAEGQETRPAGASAARDAVKTLHSEQARWPSEPEPPDWVQGTSAPRPTPQGDGDASPAALAEISASALAFHDLSAQPGASLVLLDEVGAGTDPAEGSALAIALLRLLAERARLTIATTHFGELKALKYADARFENASVAFDVDTLSPTYHLQWGIPGRSNALAIAARLGLEPAVLDEARVLLAPSGEGDVNAVIAGLESQRQRQQEAAEEAAALLARTELLHEELLERWQQQKEQSAELREQRRQELERSIRAGQGEVRRLIRRLRQAGRAQPTEAGEAARQVGQRLRKLEEAHRPAPERRDHAGWLPKVGDRVRVMSLGKAGEVLALSDDGRELTVRCGLMRLSLEITAIEGLQGEKATPPEPRQPVVAVRSRRNPASRGPEVRTARNTVDVRGLRVHEAEAAVEEQLRAANGPLWVIHGIGTGKLKRGLRDWLATVPYVERVSDADQGDGGPGCSVVWVK